MQHKNKYHIGYKTKYGKIISKTYRGPSIYWELQCICGTIYYAMSSELNQNRKQSCGCKSSKYYVGFKFGNNCELIEYLGRNNRSFRTYRCRCNCSKEFIISAAEIASRKSCGCSYKKQYCGDMPGEYWNRLIYGAKKRNILFEINKEYAWKIFVKQNGLCVYTQQKLKWDKAGKKNSTITASLDRIDSNKGYIEGNVQWMHKEIQPMKMGMSHEKFIKICNIISQNYKEQYAT